MEHDAHIPDCSSCRYSVTGLCTLYCYAGEHPLYIGDENYARPSWCPRQFEKHEPAPFDVDFERALSHPLTISEDDLERLLGVQV